jgi:hypothetical protein
MKMINMGGEFSNHLSNKIIYTLWPKVGNAAWLKAQIKISNIVELRERVLNPVKLVIKKNMEI